MRYSKLLIPTTREVPADAEIPSHKLMIRAGLIRRLGSGLYSYLPLGWRSLLKIIAIVREEMNRSGAQEVLLPSVQPIELWQKSGRSADYGQTMARFTDRHGRENVLAPTAEEVVTSLAAAEISSYKQLPFNLYQISFKFRDEFRPRFGVLRSREFIMKDAYSFHADAESLELTYRSMYETYTRIFKRCGLECVAVEAESGEMGGSGSHQFTVPCDSGEDVIVHTADGSYAANLEKAAVDPLVRPEAPADIPQIQQVHTPGDGSIGAVCSFLGTRSDEMIKTLIYMCGNGGAVAVLVRGDHELNPEKLKVAAGEGCQPAEPETVRSVTGSEVGFAGPVGLSESVNKIIVDHAVAAMISGVTGANRTDYHIRNVAPGRDFPLTGDGVVVADVRNAVEGDTHGGAKLLFRRGIEVGQVFKLGVKYSRKMGAKFLDEKGEEKFCLMGCYGIGINRILAGAIETGYDENGIIFPAAIAPFEVIMVCVNQDDCVVAQAAERIYDDLLKAGVDVLLDDRDQRGGVKFKDADLIGIPVRVTVGKRGLADGNVEIKMRAGDQIRKVPVDQAAAEVRVIVAGLKG